MSGTTPSSAAISKIKTFDDIIIWNMINEEFEERILDTKNYRLSSVRWVLFDKDKKIAIIYSHQEQYYKLPGGWIEDGEETELAMKRECKEETGANIVVGKYIWTIVEQSKAGKVIQYNRWFIAEVEGEVWDTELTQEEQERKFALHWMNINEAIELMTKNSPTSYRWRFMQERDLSFLEVAKEFISQRDETF